MTLEEKIRKDFDRLITKQRGRKLEKLMLLTEKKKTKNGITRMMTFRKERDGSDSFRAYYCKGVGIEEEAMYLNYNLVSEITTEMKWTLIG